MCGNGEEVFWSGGDLHVGDTLCWEESDGRWSVDVVDWIDNVEVICVSVLWSASVFRIGCRGAMAKKRGAWTAMAWTRTVVCVSRRGRRDLEWDSRRGRERFRGSGEVDLGTRGSGARGSGTRGGTEGGGLASSVAVVVGKLGAGRLGVGELAFVGSVGAVVEGCEGAESWSSSRRW